MKAWSLILVLLAGNAFGNFAELMKQGDQYDVQSRPEAALQYYLPAEKLDPANAALLVKIARQYVFRMNEMSSKADQLQSARTALSYAERAVKVAPDECDSHLALAICLGRLTPLVGNKEAVEISCKIKKAAETAVKLDPRNDYAWHMLGRWHQALADVGGVTRLVAKVVYGELPAASNDEAVRCFEKSIALNPGRLIHFVELGRTYAQMGKKQEAKQLINKGLAMPNREKDDPETKQRGRKTLQTLG